MGQGNKQKSEIEHV